MSGPVGVVNKCFEVELLAVCRVFVRDAENEDQAIEFAEGEISTGSFEVVELRAVPLTTKEEIDSSRRHADERCEP